MRNKKLRTLIILGTLFYLGHITDHIIRGDVPWELSTELFLFLSIVLGIYMTISLGLYLDWKKRVGPRFWMIVASVGFLFGWLAHFSPFTDQPPSYILGAYGSALAGRLAVSDLVALMLVLIVTALYSGYLWIRHAEMGNSS